MRAHACGRAYMWACVRACVCMCVCARVRAYVRSFVCARACVYACNIGFVCLVSSDLLRLQSLLLSFSAA